VSVFKVGIDIRYFLVFLKSVSVSVSVLFPDHYY